MQKIADRLNEQRPTNKAPLNVLIQINISDEASNQVFNRVKWLRLQNTLKIYRTYVYVD